MRAASNAFLELSDAVTKMVNDSYYVVVSGTTVEKVDMDTVNRTNYCPS